MLAQRGHLRKESVRVRVKAGDLRNEDFELRVGARDRCTRLQSADDRQRIAPTIRFRREWKWTEEIDVRSGRKHRSEVEPRGQYADDRR